MGGPPVVGSLLIPREGTAAGSCIAVVTVAPNHGRGHIVRKRVPGAVGGVRCSAHAASVVPVAAARVFSAGSSTGMPRTGRVSVQPAASAR
jgi:hypothetical protein